MKYLSNLFSAIERIQPISWRSLFEETRQLKGLLLRVPLVLSASMSSEVSLAAVDFPLLAV